jgi:hypothetical protein
MKSIIILLLTTTLFGWADGSFYDLYAHNRAKAKPNLITADFIASAYATYKLTRQQELETKVLKPRVVNFVNYLYLGVVERDILHKEQSLAYTATLSLLAKNGQGSIHIPDKHKGIIKRINQEIALIQEAKKITNSPISHTKIDYRVFRIPPQYKNHINYFYTMKYAQTIPMSKNLSKVVRETIKGSERLSNLERYIKQLLEQFVGLEKKSHALIPSYQSLDYHIFKKSQKPSIQDIINAISPNSTNLMVKKRLLGLYSAYDYDFKIMQSLLKSKHPNAMRGYYTQIQYKNLLYLKKISTKNPKKEPRRTHATIEKGLEEMLTVMIEGALIFSNSIKNNQTDKRIILTLKELRRIAQKKSMQLPLNNADIDFLNKLDLILLEAIGAKERPITVRVTNHLVEQLSAPNVVVFGTNANQSFGGRYNHVERL